MAGYTAELPAPSQVGGATGAGGVSGIGVLGGALSGLANIGNLVVGRMREDDARNVSNDTSKKLTDLVVNNYGETPFVGDAPTDPSKAAAAASPVVQGAVADLGRLGQANRQGKLTPAELFTRASVITQDAINQNPLFATEIRQAAQSVLGTQPTAELVRMADADNTAAEASQRALKQGLATAASQGGVIYMKPDGTLDIDKMSEAGATLNFQEHQLDLEIKAANLAAAARPIKPTEFETNNAMVAPVLKALNPTMDKVLDGMLSSVPATVAKLANVGDSQKIAAVFAAVGTQEATFNNYLGKVLAQHPEILPAAAGQIRGYYKSYFDNMRQLASGDLGHFAENVRALKDMETQGGINFRETAPGLANLHDAGGDQAVAAAVSVGLSTAPAALRGLYDHEVQSLLQNGFKAADPTAVLHGTAGALRGGGYDVTKEQNPDVQKKVLGTLIGTMNSYTRNPETLDGKTLKAFGNAVTQISGLGLQSNDPTELGNAAATLNTAGIVKTFERFSHDNPDAAHVAAAGIVALNTKNVTRSLPILAQGADTSVLLPGSGSAVEGSGPDAIKVHASSYFNPTTGRIEIQTTAVTPDGKSVQLDPTQTAQALRDFKDYRTKIDGMNRSLDTAAAMSQYSLGREKDLKALELKQLLVSGSGFPNKPGTKEIKMPDWLMKGQKQATNYPGQDNPKQFIADAVGTDPRNLSIFSGHRDPATNKKVHGSPTSSHLGPEGEAWDFAVKGEPLAETAMKLAQNYRENNVPFDQIIIEDNHVHVGYGPKRRGQVLVIHNKA